MLHGKRDPCAAPPVASCRVLVSTPSGPVPRPAVRPPMDLRLPSARVRRATRTEALSTHLQRARVVAGGVAVADPPLQRAELGHLREYSEYAEGTPSTLADPSLLVGRSHAARRWLSAVQCLSSVACCLSSAARCLLHVVRSKLSVVRCLSSVVGCTSSVARRPLHVVGGRPPSSAAVGKDSVRCCSRQRCMLRGVRRTMHAGVASQARLAV